MAGENDNVTGYLKRIAVATEAGGGGGGGDASAANQVITNTAIGATNETSAAADNSTSGLNGLIKRLLARLTVFMAQLPATLGSKAASASLAITASTEDIARVGIVTETAPASDTASSGQNGRLQRIAQNITAVGVLISAMSAKFPAALGRLAAAASTSFTLATEDKAALDLLHADLVAGTVPTTVPGTSPSQMVGMQGHASMVPIQVGTPGSVIVLTPTVDTAIYASGDVLFAVTSIASFVRANDERALLQSLTIIDKAKQKPQFDLYFFSTNVASLGAANAANALSDADALSIIGRVSIVTADWADLANNSIAVKNNIGKLLRSVSGARNVYVGAVLTAGTPTFGAAGDVQIVFDLIWS